MKKIEIIWRHLLSIALEERQTFFQQKELAGEFGFSLSTVFHALGKPRQIGAVAVGGRGLRLIDFEKLLLFWATQRNLEKEIIYQTLVDSSVLEIEASMPPGVYPTAFTAYRLFFQETPADYDRIYFYAAAVEEVRRRFPPQKAKEANLFLLKKDAFLEKYQPAPPLPQVFVDLWNIPTWYAKEYQEALLTKIKERFGG